MSDSIAPVSTHAQRTYTDVQKYSLPSDEPERAGEHTARLVNHYMHEKTGLWTPVTDGLPQLLLDSGFHDIQIIERKISVGGDTEIGISMKDNMNELMNGFRGAFNASYPLEEGEIREMFEGIERELKDIQEEGKYFDVVYNSYIARKPNA
jgi:hypothetical protein